MLTIHPVPAFEDNYIWLIYDNTSRHTLIIDPGESDAVLDYITQHRLIPMALLITHGCHDHIDGIDALLSKYSVPVYGPHHDAIPHLTHAVKAGELITLDPALPPLSVLEVPGHTVGHIAFLMDHHLFCGDTLFAAGCGRLHSGNAEQLFNSLQQISALAADTQIYCAHEYTLANLSFAITVEPSNIKTQQRIVETQQLRQQNQVTIPSSLAIEQQTNPFLRCHLPSIRQAVETHFSMSLTTPQQVFTALRQWKDDF